MDAFIRKNLSLVLSTLYLAVALVVLGYSVLYTSRQVDIADLQIATAYLNDENKRLEEELKTQTKEGEEFEEGIRSIPTFLSRINTLADDTDVIIDRFSPDHKDKLKFNIQIKADYNTFLRFASSLENLNVTIHDMQVRPYDYRTCRQSSCEPPKHLISFAITPKNDAEKLKGERLSRLKEMVAEKGKRNPFQRFAYTEESGVITDIDLTWVHKLTGISSFGDTSYATIDGIDYTVGDALSGMKITEVRSTRVHLTRETEDGTQTYLLRFRKKKASAG